MNIKNKHLRYLWWFALFLMPGLFLALCNVLSGFSIMGGTTVSEGLFKTFALFVFVWAFSGYLILMMPYLFLPFLLIRKFLKRRIPMHWRIVVYPLLYSFSAFHPATKLFSNSERLKATAPLIKLSDHSAWIIASLVTGVVFAYVQNFFEARIKVEEKPKPSKPDQDIYREFF